MNRTLSLWDPRVLAALAFVMVPTSPPALRQATGNIEGTVMNMARDGVRRASVVVTGTALSGIADDAGHYRIQAVPVGTYMLRARAAGYATTEQPGVHVVEGQTTTTDIRLPLVTLNWLHSLY